MHYEYSLHLLSADALLRKQGKLKRQLLAREGVSYIEKRIAILGGSTTPILKGQLELFLLASGVKPSFYESEYNRYYEDSIFPCPALEAFRPEIILLFTSSVNLVDRPVLGDDDVTMRKKLDAEMLRFETVWSALSSKYSAVIIQNNMELPAESPLGNLEAVLPSGMNRFIGALNERFADYASKHEGFYLHDLNVLSARIGLDRWHSSFQYQAYKFAMNYDVMPDVAKSLAKIILALLGKTKKCLVLDLDNTLWGGVVGDDGVCGLTLGHETAEGEAYLAFQSYIKRLKERGVLLAVCSKNEEDAARSGFSHPDSVLRLEDFVAFKANWKPKDVNIREIAQELNIGLDSLVFLDDNPAERQLIRDSLPEVAMPEIDPTDICAAIRTIEDAGWFEPIIISADDLRRSEAYRENRERQALKENAISYEDYLASLDMKAEIAPFREIYYDRIAQLTNKTNQFNLTTKRMTLAEIRQIAESRDHIALYGRLTDKFGDNGLVSVVIGEKRGNELHMILWLMSCRVLGRGMEQAMLDAVMKKAAEAGLEIVVGYYYPTVKNKMVANLYKDFGFRLREENDSDMIWEMQVEGYEEKNQFIDVRGAGK